MERSSAEVNRPECCASLHLMKCTTDNGRVPEIRLNKCNILKQRIIKVLFFQHKAFKLALENSLRQTTVVISHYARPH